MLIIFKTINRIFSREVFDNASQLSYYFLISLFPFLLVLVTLLGYLPISTDHLLDIIADYAPGDTYQMIKENLNFIMNERRGGLLSASILVTIYLASLGFQSLIRILDRAYGGCEERSVWRELLLGLFLMLGFMVALVSSLLLPIFDEMLSIIRDWSFAWLIIRWVLGSIALFGIYLGIYILSPNLSIRVHRAWPGALLATLGWQLSSILFSFYVTFSDYSLVYGTLGGIIILLGWIYWSALILILGGRLNAYIYMKYDKQEVLINYNKKHRI